MAAIILVLSLIVASIVLIVLARIQHKKKENERTQALQRMAEYLGWSFEPAPALESIAGIDSCVFFDFGYDKEIRNLMYRETDDVNTAVFDYIYTTGTTKHRTVNFQSVAQFELPEQSSPDFSLRPESVFDKVFSKFGYQDLDFGQRPEFFTSCAVRTKPQFAKFSMTAYFRFTRTIPAYSLRR
jgi:hypothetical protein